MVLLDVIVQPFLGVRTLPLFAPFNAFRRLLTPDAVPIMGCQSGVGRFLRVLGGASLSPIRRTGKIKPAESQRVLYVNQGYQMKLKIL